MEEKYLPVGVVELFEQEGFEPKDRDNVTCEEVFKWLREKKNTHINILAGMERNGDIHYFLKNMIIGHTELTYKKHKFNSWEDAAEFALNMII